MNTLLSDALRGVSECPLRCGRNGGTPSGRDPIARWQRHLRHISSGCSPGIRRARRPKSDKAENPAPAGKPGSPGCPILKPEGERFDRDTRPPSFAFRPFRRHARAPSVPLSVPSNPTFRFPEDIGQTAYR